MPHAHPTAGAGDAPPIRSALAAVGPSERSRLQDARDAIDRLDHDVARLLHERTRHARLAALAKLLTGQAARCLAREAHVRHAYADALVPRWTRERAQALARVVTEPDSPPRVIIQGGPGSWSEESLLAALPGVEVVRASTVTDAWRRCLAGEAVAAWLAASNTTIGEVEGTRFARVEGEAWFEVACPVRHALLARPGVALGDITRVEAHPLAHAQCRATLARVVPRAALVPTIDGAHSAARLSRATRGTAVLASPKLAASGVLDVLLEAATDDPANATSFQLLVPC